MHPWINEFNQFYEAFISRLESFDEEGLIDRIKRSGIFQKMDYPFRLTLSDNNLQSLSQATESGYFFVATEVLVNFANATTPPSITLKDRVNGREFFQGPDYTGASAYSSFGPGPTGRHTFTEPGAIFLPLGPQRPIEVTAQRHPNDVSTSTVDIIVSGWKFEYIK